MDFSYTNNTAALKNGLRRLLLQSASCYDTVGENFYHGLLLSLCALMDNRYIITSNRESGEGRYDISLCPRDSKMPGILIELKAASNASASALRELADTALLQIKEKRYDTEMRTKGIQTVFKYGVAFSGKNVEISAE